MRLLIFVSLLIVAHRNVVEVQGRFQLAFQWRSLSFRNLPYGSSYNFTHPVPFGIAKHRNRIFIGVPRRNRGIPATLAFINLNDQGNEPALNAYPSFQVNSLHPQNFADPNRIVSVYRPRVDECERLWFVDTGVLEFPENRVIVQRPSLWIINLNSDSLIRRFEIPPTLVDNGRGLVSLTIDDPASNCHDTFAYITDWLNSRLIVFSLQQSRAWVVDHNFFHFDPLHGNFNVGGFQFTRRDGLFSVTLSHRQRDGYKIAFFHAMCSDAEFVVSTEILRNESLATRTFHGKDFKLLGHRGSQRSQSGIHVFDLSTRVLLSTKLQQNAVDCWRFDYSFSSSSIDIVDQNDETLYYPVDLTIDGESTVWVLSNKMPRVIYSQLNFDENNFYILRASVKDLIQGKKCNVRDGIKADELLLRVSDDDDD